LENVHYEVIVTKPDDWVNLWFIGDWHIGSVACNEKKLDKDIKKILKSENPHVFYMGDGLEAICYRDKRFDPMAIHPRYRDHLGDIFRSQLKQVKERIDLLDGLLIGCHIGNHELACSKYFQYDPHAELLETFQLRNLQYSALTQINVSNGKKKLYDFVVHTRHGIGQVKTMPSFQNRTQHIKADIKVIGHNHHLGFERVDALEHRKESGGDVQDKPEIWGFSGSYLRTYASGMVGYGEERGYPPVPLGCLNIKVRRDPEEPDRLEFEARTT